MNLKNALQTVTLLLLCCVSLPGYSKNKPEEAAKISTEVSPEEAASVAALEKKLRQSAKRENLTTWTDLDKMLRSYARATYSPKPATTPGTRCVEVLYERVPYKEGASFMRKFVTKQSSGGEYLLQNLAASDSNFPVFIKAKIDVAGTTVPIVVVLNALDKQAEPIILDFIQAGLVKKSSNKKEQGFDSNCSCTPHVGKNDNLPLLFVPTGVPFEPYHGGGFTDQLPANFNTFPLPRL